MRGGGVNEGDLKWVSTVEPCELLKNKKHPNHEPTLVSLTSFLLTATSSTSPKLPLQVQTVKRYGFAPQFYGGGRC